MPYIKQYKRDRLNDSIIELSDSIDNSGELNYVITQLCLLENPESYEDYNRVIGVLECVKQEFYRRAVAKYEDLKCEECGDVYE